MSDTAGPMYQWPDDESDSEPDSPGISMDQQDSGLIKLHQSKYARDGELSLQVKGYPHPFLNFSEDESGMDWDGSDLPRALVELRMCEMSNVIREKERWWEKMRNPEILEKWRQEVEAQEVAVDVKSRLTPLMINYVLQELTGYDALRDPETDIQPACFHRIWRSDALISSTLRDRLLAAVALLEATSPADWHPGSDGKVLDLVHPSLYPVVYGRTNAWDSLRQHLAPLKPPQSLNLGGNQHLSPDFCWLPSDFSIASDGNASLVSPYINNVDTSTEAGRLLIPVITSLVQAAVPLWERVLSDLRAPLPPVRIQQKTGESWNEIERFLPCIWGDEDIPSPELLLFNADPDADFEDPAVKEAMEAYEKDPDAWYAEHPELMHLPEALDGYDGALERTVIKTVDLKGVTLQVIVKLANIVLTPEKPEYGGGTWHVEGMQNERIVSTFIYYYDEENITPSSLAFRTAVNPPAYHYQDDNYCTRTIYGLDREQLLVQDRGRIPTVQHRCIAFPNIYQHCVSPFSLADPTRPGHRKIVALFLVDPTPGLRIPSATDVPPQQASWYDGVMQDVDRFFAQKNLPLELRDRVVGELREQEGGHKMSREEAENVRERFMAERTRDANEMNTQEWGRKTTTFALPFNMCEH